MKFLLAVLAIHFIAEMITGKIKGEKENKTGDVNENILHPAEYELR